MENEKQMYDLEHKVKVLMETVKFLLEKGLPRMKNFLTTCIVATLLTFSLLGCTKAEEGAVVQSPPLENMVLTQIGGTCGDIEITNPTSEDIARVIGGLVAANFATDSFFAILSDEDDRSGQTYLQVMYEESTDGYTIEYRDGAEDKHYQDNTSVVSSHQLIKLFIAYAKRDIGWLDEMKFQRLHILC